MNPEAHQAPGRNSKVLRVLSLSPWPDFWSMGNQAGAPDDYQIVRGFARNGHRVLHLAPWEKGLSAQEDCGGILIRRFPYTPLKSNRWLLRTRLMPLLNWLHLNYRITCAALRLSRAEPCDVVLGHSGVVTLAARIVSAIKHVPCVVHYYGTFLYPLLRKGARFLDPEYWDWRVPVSKRVILNDGTQGDLVASHLGLNREDYVFWMNGVDKEDPARNFDPVAFRHQAGIPVSVRVVFAACRLVAWKRIDRLVAAAPWLLKKRSDFLFIIAGDGSRRDSLIQQARELGVVDHFRFLGAIPRSEVRNYMKVADIVASVNDLSNVGNPLLEALECGKAIVTLDVGATNTVIRHGENGLLVKPDDPLALAQAIEQVLADSALRQRLERNARVYADDRLLPWDQRADMEVRLVEEMCQKKPVPL